ncbi:hypothetical protein ACLB2K_016628 [Fragaria x ananassa]
MVTQKGTPDSATTDSGLCPHLTTSIISDARPHCCDRYRSLHRRHRPCLDVDVLQQDGAANCSSVVRPPPGARLVFTSSSHRPQHLCCIRFHGGAMLKENRRGEVFSGFAGEFTNLATAADMNGGGSFASIWITSL